MNWIVSAWNKWLFDEYKFLGAEAVGAFRVFYCLAMFLVGFNSYSSISRYAPELYNPKRIFFQLLDYFILLCLILLLFGFRAKWTSLILGLALIIGNSFLYSFDKISHGNLLTTFIPLVMAFSNWGARFSIERSDKQEVEYWPVSLMSFIIGFGMFTAGVFKVVGGWLNPSYQAIKFHVFKSFLNLREGLFTGVVVEMGTPVLWEVMDYVIVIFEIGFLLVVFNRKWFQGWIVAAIFFHIGVLLVLDISFSKNVVVYFLFLNWAFILGTMRYSQFLSFLTKGFNYPTMVVFILAIFAIKYFFGSPYLMSHLPFDKAGNSSILFGLALLVIFGSWFQIFYERRTPKNVSL